MRLDYAKGGLQFFFVTLASAERRAVFSRLVSEGGRPELLDIGELARAALRAVHRVWPAVTVSDYVIMPDHLHFLLIVNYDYDKSIGPLFIAHRVADAVEMAVARSLERTGALAPAKLAEQRVAEIARLLKASVEAANVEKARHGMVPVSGFISPGEKEALRRLKAEPRARFVKLLPYTLPARYDPSAEDCREIAAGRLLILSCFRDTPGISSLDMKHNRAAAHRFRQNCLAMNDIAARLSCRLITPTG